MASLTRDDVQKLWIKFYDPQKLVPSKNRSTFLRVGKKSLSWESHEFQKHPSYSIIFHHIPSYSIIFHHIPSYSTIFHHIPSYSMIFHHIPSSKVVFLMARFSLDVFFQIQLLQCLSFLMGSSSSSSLEGEAMVKMGSPHFGMVTADHPPWIHILKSIHHFHIMNENPLITSLEDYPPVN